MRLVISLSGIDETVRRHAGFMQDLEAELYEALREQARETRDQWKAASPVFTGALREGVRFRSSRRRLTAKVIGAPHAWLVQYGRRPGRMPSVDPAHASNPKSAQRLKEWAEAHNIEPFVLARAIAKKGTQPHPFRSIGRAKETFEARIQAAVDRVVARYLR